jgi:hypothetical protein
MYVLTATRPSLNKTTNDPEVETKVFNTVETHTKVNERECRSKLPIYV